MQNNNSEEMMKLSMLQQPNSCITDLLGDIFISMIYMCLLADTYGILDEELVSALLLAYFDKPLL